MSGSGKTTLLAMLAGLLRLSAALSLLTSVTWGAWTKPNAPCFTARKLASRFKPTISSHI